MTQLTLSLEAKIDWSRIDSDCTDLTALARRTAFLSRAKRLRSRVEGLLPALGERKRGLIERAPEGQKDLTQYVADRFRISACERNLLTQFLREAYPNASEQRWESVHDAEVFNTARSVYRKAGGFVMMPLDELLHRAAQDRAARKHLAHAIPVYVGFGLRDEPRYTPSKADPLIAHKNITRSPGILVAYATRQHFLAAFERLGADEAQRVGVAGGLQIATAREALSRFRARLAERYDFKDLRIHPSTLDADKAYAI